MSALPGFCINTPVVVCEVVGGESILIHFDKGSYYSSDQEGARIIDGLATGQSLQVLTGELSNRSGAPMTSVTAVVNRFLQLLLDEDIIRPTQETSSSKIELPVDEDLYAQYVATGHPVPHLETYTDLKDLLILDPIHDVDAAGWPRVKP